MKKTLRFILLIVLSISIITVTYTSLGEYSLLSRYRLKCQRNNEAACANYLFLESWIGVKKESYTTNIDKQDWNYWKKRYLNKLKNKEDAYVAIDTMLASLDDPYTRFLTTEQMQDQQFNIDAKLSGIGVVIYSSDGKIAVEDVIENSPAAKNGLKIGDIILKINGDSVSGLDIKTIANRIRGPKDSQVELSILRKNKIFKKIITRDTIAIKAVKYKQLEDNIAYIKISTFMSQAASSEFTVALAQAANSRAIILDLRGNQGGLLQNATSIASMLLNDGVIVSIHKKGDKTETINVDRLTKHIEDKPMVVLTNGYCASAGEILAAALQENARAKLVGEKTYGKGLIQRIIPLPLDTAMNVTIAKYLTPKGHDINKNGIKPDYYVKLTSSDVKSRKDPQLEKAIELLK